MLLSVRFMPLTFLLAMGPLTEGGFKTAAASTLEELIAVEDTATGVTITVPTGGCTKKTDFEVNASAPQNGKASVEFRRLNGDVCKGNFPDGLKLQFSWAELKLPEGTKLSIMNPVEPPFVIKDPVKNTKQKGTRQRRRHRHHAAFARISSSGRAIPAKHKRLRRHAVPKAKVHVRSHTHSHVRTHAARARFCLEYPHSRHCRRLKHGRVHRRRFRCD